MMYRFHYQLDETGVLISSAPRATPEHWKMRLQPYHAAVAYIEASSLSEAYSSYCHALEWWNAHLGAPVFEWPQESRTWGDVIFFCSQYTVEPLETSRPDTYHAPKRRRTLRPPLSGDVIEQVGDCAYMLVHQGDETHPHAWMRITPGGVEPYSDSLD